MIVDYHMHLRSPTEEIEHTVGAVERFVETADRRGIDEIGFTEHVYYFRETLELWDIPYQYERCCYELEGYCDAVVEAKRQGYPVKLGLEVDWVPSRADRLAELLRPYPWDYLLGSIHFIDGLGIDAPPSLIEKMEIGPAFDRYFDELTDLAGSGLVDVLAHPDLVKFFGRRPDEPRLRRLHAEAASRLGRTGVALEISTAGLHKPVGELYPDPQLLALARAEGVPITLASDAHSPQNLGRDLDRAIEHARDAGYDTITVFDERGARQEPLG